MENNKMDQEKNDLKNQNEALSSDGARKESKSDEVSKEKVIAKVEGQA